MAAKVGTVSRMRIKMGAAAAAQPMTRPRLDSYFWGIPLGGARVARYSRMRVPAERNGLSFYVLFASWLR